MSDVSGIDAFNEAMDRLANEIEARAGFEKAAHAAEVALREERRTNKAETEQATRDRVRLGVAIGRLAGRLTHVDKETVDHAHALARAAMGGAPLPPPHVSDDDIPF